MNPAEIREGDVIRLTPDGPACRVYRDRNRSKDTVEFVNVDGVRMARFVTGAGLVTVPAAQRVDLVGRHGNRRPVSLTKAWYFGSIDVGSAVTYRHAPAGAVFRVVDIIHGPSARYLLAPWEGGDVVHTDARVGDLTLVRSRVVGVGRAGQPALFEAGDAA